ncbi:MAG TPA: type 4a pilus biogenesis protein PilO [Actinomycetota bacterium]|jgi:Tfp pilus assembly protein PilO
MSGRRAPLFAAIAAGAVVLLAVFFLVLPKRSQVSEAKAELETVQQQTVQLRAQLASLAAARENAPEARQEIRQVDNQLPPTMDEPGLLLLIKNSVERSGIEFADISVANPTPGVTGTFSTVPVSVSIEGTYFSLASFLNKIETLPRAAKVLTGAISVATSSSTELELSMQISMELYTSDLSAGPGSEPGPTTTTGA